MFGITKPRTAARMAVSADNPLNPTKRIKTGYNGRQKGHRQRRTAARRQIRELMESMS